MIFKLLRALQIYWLKVLMHINGQNCNLRCFMYVSTKFQNTFKCSSIENRVQSLYRELHTYQIKFSTHHYRRFHETKYGLDVLTNSRGYLSLI